MKVTAQTPLWTSTIVSLCVTALLMLAPRLADARVTPLGPVQIVHLDEIVRTVMGESHINGLAMGVAEGGMTLYVHGYGFADRARRVRTTPATGFAIGSITKSFTAAAVLTLVARGDLALNDRLGTLVPMYRRGHDVTLRDVLQQTSGIPDYTHLPSFDRSRRRPVSAHGLIGRIASLPLRFQPATDWAYSNTNYVLAALAVQRASGQPYQAYLQRALLTPLHLHRTHLAWPFLRNPDDAQGNLPLGSPTLAFGSADLSSDVPDLLRWGSALMAGRALPRRYARTLWQPAQLATGQRIGYGEGLFLERDFGRRVAWASGYVNGFSAFFMLVPQRRVVIALLANQNAVDLGPLARSILAIVLDARDP
ncbi:MAG: serine hydrolase domain-containing protein [Vulcanimicrobiaceae bacterium]